MRIVILTGNATRHKFVANTLARNAHDSLVVSECAAEDYLNVGNLTKKLTKIEKHFLLRKKTEKLFFRKDSFFISNTVPIIYKEVNSPDTYGIIKKFKPDAIFSFGSSIIKKPLLTLLPLGHFINLHLGLSPYYRGSGTNFWPFVNKELEYVGSTIMHIDDGVDTGDIIVHVLPKFEAVDNVHTAGCKVIMASAGMLVKIIHQLRRRERIKRVKQWKIDKPRYYRNGDFNENALARYKKNLENGLVGRFLKGPRRDILLVTNKSLQK